MFRYLFSLPLLLFAHPVGAEPLLQKKQLAELCSSDDRWYGGLCNGYITGTVESLLEMREQGLISEAFCFPANIKRGNFIDTIRSEITMAPSPSPAFETIVLILKDKYPCE